MKRILFFIFTVCAPVVAMAQSAPQAINYQGRLTDNAGAPMGGTHTLFFRIWDSEAETGLEHLLWIERHENVALVQGNFNILLGTGTPLTSSGAALATTIAGALKDSPRYVGVTVDSVDIANEIRPRQFIASAPFALSADYAEFAAAAGNGVPVGTIVATMVLGDQPGWLVCDGRIIDKATNPEYTALVDLLRNKSRNGGVGSEIMRVANQAATRAWVPNLRGRFIRGVNDGGTELPENTSVERGDAGAAARVDPHTNLFSGSVPGSFQDDVILGANESTAKEVANADDKATRASLETRPINMAVNFLIKY